MLIKYNLILFFLLVFSINAFAEDANTQLGYSEIEAAERQHIIDELTYRLNTKKNCNPVQKWTDKDSGADLDGYFFIPSVENNFFMIGGLGVQSRKASLCVMTVSEPKNNPENTPPLLAAPIDWEMIWNDKGSGAHKDGSMWEAIPPDNNYKCLGSIPQNGYKKPALPNYRCVHVSLTKKVTSNSVIWSEKGSNADKKVTMFKLPNTNSFVAVKGRVAKAETYDLKADPSAKPDPKRVEEELARRMEKIRADLDANMKAEIEQRKLAEAEKQKQLTVAEAEKKLAEEAEQKRQAKEAKQKRLAEEAEQQRLAEEAEQKRLAEETEQQRLAEEAKQNQLAEAAEQDQVVEEITTAEMVAARDESTIASGNDKKSSGLKSLVFYILKIFLVVIGLFILLGIIIFKFTKRSKNKSEG